MLTSLIKIRANAFAMPELAPVMIAVGISNERCLSQAGVGYDEFLMMFILYAIMVAN